MDTTPPSKDINNELTKLIRLNELIETLHYRGIQYLLAIYRNSLVIVFNHESKQQIEKHDMHGKEINALCVRAGLDPMRSDELEHNAKTGQVRLKQTEWQPINLEGCDGEPQDA